MRGRGCGWGTRSNSLGQMRVTFAIAKLKKYEKIPQTIMDTLKWALQAEREREGET